MKNETCIRIQADYQQISHCKNTIEALENSFETLSKALHLAGNSTRLKILYLLFEEHKLCVCDISDILSMNISAISQHLRKLKDRNLVTSTREAQTIFYTLSSKYKEIFTPFFKLIDGNKILETA